MPLTHDIGVRIPYPLQKEKQSEMTAFSFCSHIDSPAPLSPPRGAKSPTLPASGNDIFFTSHTRPSRPKTIKPEAMPRALLYNKV